MTSDWSTTVIAVGVDEYKYRKSNQPIKETTQLIENQVNDSVLILMIFYFMSVAFLAALTLQQQQQTNLTSDNKDKNCLLLELNSGFCRQEIF